MPGVEPPSLAEIRAARERVAGLAMRTPLVRLNAEPSPGEIHLKLENLQPIGSFKLRGAGNAMAAADPAALARGVCTASAGNMAQGVAWCARRRGVACTVVMPDHAPQTKQAAVERLGARTIKVPFDEWWQSLVDRRCPGVEGVFIHPVSDRAVMAGNGTIALEVLEDLPEVDAVLVPYGGGGLSCGIASALRALRPQVKVFACEVETAAPLQAAWRAGRPAPIDYRPSFVDGIGGKAVLAEMWPIARRLLDGSLVVSLDEVAAAIRLLAERNHVVAEGAGAAPVAAALSGRAGSGKLACIVSGGNIDPAKLAVILQGGMP
ncbi:MAG: pyridoxal-5'-phosphate-dependent protein subunit beta [Acidobacteria bacterium]|nr:MAG: pyridoxal-5'-phosphate-dependent protein subunit beta [Acidobacteriota bacterium]